MTYKPSDHEVETFSGFFVDTENPHPNTIQIRDIAHALANTCRYGGHCQKFYSVAEHAVFVSKRVERKGYGTDAQLEALHHDDAEAFLGDIPRPLKPLLGQTYKDLTETMDRAIAQALELPLTPRYHRQVKGADNWALFVEAKYLLPSKGRGWARGEQGSQDWDIEDVPSRIVVPDYWLAGLEPEAAEELYLDRHDELKGRA